MLGSPFDTAGRKGQQKHPQMGAANMTPLLAKKSKTRNDSSDQEDDRERRKEEEIEKECISNALKLKNESGCVCYDPHHTELSFCES